MRRNLLISLVLLVIVIFMLRMQSSLLITPSTRYGLIHLEFTTDVSKLQWLQLIWSREEVGKQILLHLVFVFSFAWFLISLLGYFQSRTNWKKLTDLFRTMIASAALFATVQGMLLYLIFVGKLTPSLLVLSFILTLIKYLLGAAVMIFLVVSWPFVLRYRRKKTIKSKP